MICEKRERERERERYTIYTMLFEALNTLSTADWAVLKVIFDSADQLYEPELNSSLVASQDMKDKV